MIKSLFPIYIAKLDISYAAVNWVSTGNILYRGVCESPP